MTPQQISDRGNQNRLSEGLTHDAREVYKLSATENPTRPNQNTRNRHRTSCVTSVTPPETYKLSLAAGQCPQGFSPSRPRRSAVASGQPGQLLRPAECGS